MTVTVRPPLLSAPLKKQWGTADVIPNLLVTTLAVVSTLNIQNVTDSPPPKKAVPQQQFYRTGSDNYVNSALLPGPYDYDVPPKRPYPPDIGPPITAYLPVVAVSPSPGLVYIYPGPPQKKWAAWDVPSIVTFLPTAPPPNARDLFDNLFAPRKLPPPIPVRVEGRQKPFSVYYSESVVRKAWADDWIPQIITSLPTATPPTHDLYDSGVIPPKRPPPVPVGRRTLPLPAAPSNGYDAGVPPKKYPPHVPNRVQQPGAAIPLTVLAQLQTEFDPWGIPKKVYPEQPVAPNIVIEPLLVPTPFTYDYPSKVTVRWPEDAAFPNIASLPPLIGLAQQQPDFDAQGIPPRKWAQDAPSPNIALEPLLVPTPFSYDYPAKVTVRWVEDAAPPNVAAQPLAVIPAFHYDYPSVPRKFSTIEAAPQDFWALPNLALPIAQYDWPALPKKVWPEEWIQPNVLQTIPLTPITFGSTQPFEFFKYVTVRLVPDFQSPYPLTVPAVPIYIPLVGYEIYETPRTFTVATPVRTFSLMVPWRTFTITSQTVQTFDVKDPAESWPLTFNMGPDLFSGETLAGAPTITVNLIQGADPNPTAILNGVPGFDQTTTQVIQPVTGGVAGCTYQIIATCATTNPLKILTLVGALPVNR